MSEADMRKNLVEKLKDLDAKPIENPMRAGTPDINYIDGWIECKWMRRWPKGCNENPVSFTHPLSKEQGIWLNRRWKKGGRCYVALQVKREWFFFAGSNVQEYFGKVSRLQLIQYAALYFDNGLNDKKLIEFLKRG